MNFIALIDRIELLNSQLSMQAQKAVNKYLTLRNWLIGYYIVEFEQHGEERSAYGGRLLKSIADELKIKNATGLSETNLKAYRRFYLLYPEISQTLSDFSDDSGISQTPSDISDNSGISQTLSDFSDGSEKSQTPSETSGGSGIIQTPSEVSGGSEKSQTVSDKLMLPKISDGVNVLFADERVRLAGKLVDSLSFSHITLLIAIEDELARTFYAVEAIRGTWSYRELKRQISSLLYERSGISKQPDITINQMMRDPFTGEPQGLVKDVYTFEFLGLPVKDAVEESALETALLDNLREFILELGEGFCLEGRQKRILIGGEYYFIDLVFYHRLLKCHVLVELKVDSFTHANAGQLNTYLNYYKHEVKLPDDADPVGILMVTDKNDALVKYATAGMDENLFVSQYKLKLPEPKQIEAFIRQELTRL